MDYLQIAEDASYWVERIFGPFDPSVRIERINVVADIKAPYTFYPAPVRWNVVEINVPHSDEPHAVYQALTHELVHCLRPNGPPSYQATYFEEGLAEHSCLYFMKEYFPVEHEDGIVDEHFWRNSRTGKYGVAFDLIEEIVRHEGLDEMREKVRDIRESGLPLCAITPDIMAQHFTNTPASVLADLGRNFATG